MILWQTHISRMLRRGWLIRKAEREGKSYYFLVRDRFQDRPPEPEEFDKAVEEMIAKGFLVKCGKTGLYTLAPAG